MAFRDAQDERHLDPERADFDAFKKLPRDTPIAMLNLLKFFDEAQYPDDHASAGKGWSGSRAYHEYGKTSGPIFARVGGTIIWRGAMEAVLIGPPEIEWDAAFIARYPNAGAFLEMVSDPEYQKAVVNRQAAVRTSRLIRFGEVETGDGFA